MSGNGTPATDTFDSVSINSTAALAPVITAVSTTTASVGSQVGIIGNNFGATQGGSAVLLNGTPVTVNLWGNTGIVFTIPVGATSGPLLVSVAPNMNDSNPVNLEVTTQPLPAPWLNQDVGVVGQTGSATYSDGTFTVTGAGLGIVGYTVDAMQFAYQTLSGDGSIVAQLINLQDDSSQVLTEAGVMIRETLDSGAADASVFYGNNNAVNIEVRPATGASAIYEGNNLPGTLPVWVKLTRAGNSFTGYGSPDGANWTYLGNATIPMAQTVYIGLAVSGTFWQAGVIGDGFLEPANFYNASVTPTPSISSVTPTIGPIGTPVTITGSNFGTTQGSNSVVQFSGALATSIISWSNSQIVAAVPSAALSGTGSVAVTVNTIPNEGSAQFTVINPVITSLLPPAGPVGGTISINGSGFGAYQNGVVSINGVTASVQSWSNTLIQVTIPAATSGPLTVSNDAIVSNSLPFTVSSSPAITGLSTNAGAVGTVVTINGSGFDATQSNSTVAFGGVAASASSWSDSQIIVPVPPNAITGPLTVTVAGVTAQGPNFTVTFAMALTSSANPSTYNIAVTFTATVTPLAATGTVTFKDGSTPLGTSTISSSGVATFSTSTLANGSHSITVVYNGNSSYPSSTSPTLTQVVMAVASIAVTPASLSLPVGSVQRYVATAIHSDSSTQ